MQVEDGLGRERKRKRACTARHNQSDRLTDRQNQTDLNDPERVRAAAGGLRGGGEGLRVVLRRRDRDQRSAPLQPGGDSGEVGGLSPTQ